MAFEYDRLTEITTLATAAAAVFTNPAAQTTYIRSIEIHNGNTSAEAVKLYDVPDNAGAVGTAATTNEFYSETLLAGATRLIEYEAPGKILKDENDTIQGVTDTVSKVTLSIMGGKE